MLEQFRGSYLLQGRSVSEFFYLLISFLLLANNTVLALNNNLDSQLVEEFKKYDPDFVSKKESLKKTLKKLKRRLIQAEKQGRDMSCSRQIYLEVKYLVSYTAHFEKAESRLNDLKNSLNVENQAWAAEQKESDGSWGQCFKEFFLILNYSTDKINDLKAQDKVPNYQVRFLNRINSPGKLIKYLDAIIISNIEKDGVNHRKELNHSLASLIRLIKKKLPRNYSYHPQLEATLWQYIDTKMQNPNSGFWGAWYIFGEKLLKTDDLSITFHIVSYRKGTVHKLDKIARSTLVIKNINYPYGWLEGGEMRNHHNMDVVSLLKYSWAFLPDRLQELAKADLEAMIYWSLNHSLDSSGEFLIFENEDSLIEATYFGVSFLEKVGFFRSKNRFWRRKPFSEARGVCNKILEKTKLLPKHEGMVQDTLSILSNCSVS